MQFLKVFLLYVIFNFPVHAEPHHHEMTGHEVKEDHSTHEAHLELGTLGLYSVNREASLARAGNQTPRRMMAHIGLMVIGP